MILEGYGDLRNTIALLEKEEGNILRIKDEVDPKYEMSAIAERLFGGPGLIFERLKGYDIPACANFYSKERIIKLLGTTAADMPYRMIDVAKQATCEPMLPKMVSDGPCKEVVHRDNIDLNAMFPIPWQTPKDCANYLGASMVVTKDPKTGLKTTLIARSQMKGPDKLQIRFQPMRRPTDFYRWKEAEGKPLELALCLGVGPALMLATASHGPLVEGIGGEYKLKFAGTMAGKPVEMVKCETIDVEVPAEAEIVVEVEMLPGIREMEDSDNPTGRLGPGGPGYYARAIPAPVCRVKAVTHRRNPIYYACYGRGDYALVNVMLEAAQLSAAKTIAPRQVLGINHFHPMTVIKFQKEAWTDDGYPKNVLMAALGADRDCHLAVVVDEDIDITDGWAVLYAIITRARMDKDVFMVQQARGHGVIPVAREQAGLVTKVGIDATIPFPMKDKFEKNDFIDVDVERFIKGFIQRPWYEH